MEKPLFRSEPLAKFYPIFDSYHWLEQMIPLGIKLVQLRIKDMSESEIEYQIKRAKKICDQYHCQLVINDYWQLAIETQCDFVHLGQEDLDTADLNLIKQHSIRLGISTHSQAELLRALACKPDYIALGPVYPTILKKMVWKQQGLSTVTKWKKQIKNIPLVGIGGINLERATGVFHAGADIVSAVTDISLNEDPEKRVKDWLELTSRL